MLSRTESLHKSNGAAVSFDGVGSALASKIDLPLVPHYDEIGALEIGVSGSFLYE